MKTLKKHFESNPFIPVGAVIQERGADEKFMLAQVQYRKVAAIGLKYANRWLDPVKVNNCSEITEKEMDSILGKGLGVIHDWDLVSISPPGA